MAKEDCDIKVQSWIVPSGSSCFMQDSKAHPQSLLLEVSYQHIHAAVNMLKNIHIIQIVLIRMYLCYQIPIPDFCSQYHRLKGKSTNMMPAKRTDRFNVMEPSDWKSCLIIYCHDCSGLGGANIQITESQGISRLGDTFKIIEFALSCYEILNYETREIKNV